jgi:hypothetical protein
MSAPSREAVGRLTATEEDGLRRWLIAGSSPTVATGTARRLLATLDAERAARAPEGGVERIAAERRRQIEVERYSAEHDAYHGAEDENAPGPLARAGAVYATPPEYRYEIKQALWPYSWPFKPTPNDRIRELEKAGALIAAEIDRLTEAWRKDVPGPPDPPRREHPEPMA